MFEEMTEQQAREQILEMTKEYCEKYHNQKKPYEKGDRIPYASRVYDADEMVNLVDSSLEFWLTSGRFTKEFESEFAPFLYSWQALRLHRQVPVYRSRLPPDPSLPSVSIFFP